MRLTPLDLPPSLVRVLARNGPRSARVPMTRGEIARGAGTSIRTVDRLSKLRSFESVTVGLANRFCAACGVTRENLRRHIAFARRSPALFRKNAALLSRILK